jgi:DNA-binding transcriptional regulator PaaX
MFDQMHNWAGLPLVTELAKFQLSMLDAYEKLLACKVWDEAELNQALKGMLASLLPLMQTRHTMQEQLVSTQKAMLQQYRHFLENLVRQQDESRSQGL